MNVCPVCSGSLIPGAVCTCGWDSSLDYENRLSLIPASAEVLSKAARRRSYIQGLLQLQQTSVLAENAELKQLLKERQAAIEKLNTIIADQEILIAAKSTTIENQKQELQTLRSRNLEQTALIKAKDEALQTLNVWKNDRKAAEEKLNEEIRKLRIRNEELSLQLQNLQEKAEDSKAQAPVYDTEYYYDRGKQAYDQKDWETALKNFTAAINQNPPTALKADTALYYHYRGMARYRLRQYEASVPDFTSAISLCPGNARYYNDRGNALYFLKRYGEAISDFSRAAELAPNTAHYHGNLAGCLYRLNRNQEALIHINTALGIDPENPTYLNLKKKIHAVQK